MSKRRKQLCNCEADETRVGPVEDTVRIRARKASGGHWLKRPYRFRGSKVHHRLGDKHFWPWKGTPVRSTP